MKEAFKLWKRTREEKSKEEYTNLNKISKIEVVKAKDKTSYRQSSEWAKEDVKNVK